jgi:hypothetical protein
MCDYVDSLVKYTSYIMHIHFQLSTNQLWLGQHVQQQMETIDIIVKNHVYACEVEEEDNIEKTADEEAEKSLSSFLLLTSCAHASLQP